MKLHHIKSSCLLAPALALALMAGARADETTNTIKFSDSSKPGTLKISLARGDVSIQGTDASEVSVKSDSKPNNRPRKDGLRELASGASFSLSEKENVVVLDAMSDGAWGKGGGNFKISVPRTTTVVVQNVSGGGDVKCAGISGDVEINSMHGEIRLDDVSGGVVVGTMNGEIRANIRELRDGKPLSFTSMNGEVAIRLPEKAKANVRLRTQNGSVLTDFEEAALVTKTEASNTPFKGKSAITIKSNRGLSVEIQDAIRDATEISATAVRQALEAVKEGFESSKLNMDEARKQVEEARKDLERFKRDAERDQRRTAVAARAGRNADANENRNANAEPKPMPAPAVAPMPPAPGAWAIAKIPTISGGKLVTGTLNGGGPEISVSTMNGDVILRKLEPAK